MPEDRDLFCAYRDLLRQVVTARGGDPARVDAEYVWPTDGEATPRGAQSLSPLLTGGGVAPTEGGGADAIPAPENPDFF